MGKKHKCPECPAGEKWAVPYADFLSLLLALFIALWAISETNPAKTEALKTEFVKIFEFTASNPVEKESETYHKYSSPSNANMEELEKLKKLNLTQQETIEKLKAALDQKENNVVLNLPARVEFSRGSVEINSADVQDFLKHIADVIIKMPPQAQVELRGYTDNSDKSHKRNFDLASKRSQIVADYLINRGVNPDQLIVVSFGDNYPLMQDKEDEKNNRVEFYIRIDSSDTKTKKSVLDQIKQLK
ncbi:flagellar motor protein MotB [Campylobacter insulaenigrae]|uniref:flagellar motor protein MotB n=1 Tax=Campylobacter insulaenigrae TaxID=260714 RepID=UPI000F6DEF73|nr:flagellar motor protein MotB [Campylobacter insulaenigrae]MCR6591758.1 flagellar motor protein MotB [Campylobacter insulaenigrae]MCR6593250.1 flagellar motor protein MotB [Campylobacter insulaenigrae]MCR6594654.1 flagellar motor protein MotB [Campylobacter insulaenigrae]VEJ55145.1 flagellar motor protein MotB [Campylobacter insulaenigrae]